MVDIEKLLTAAIRQVECPEPGWHRIEVEIVQRVRAALETQRHVSIAAFHTGSSPCSGRICAGRLHVHLRVRCENQE